MTINRIPSFFSPQHLQAPRPADLQAEDDEPGRRRQEDGRHPAAPRSRLRQRVQGPQEHCLNGRAEHACAESNDIRKPKIS